MSNAEQKIEHQSRAPVRILENSVINQIAAGEVVERPVSVVKELVENAIDADASQITVIIDNGGKSRIEVIDDGMGMTKEDALIAIERFGTSKISSPDDIHSIKTLGFRGEALPSIASVSKFSITSRSREAAGKQGVQISIDGGEMIECLDLACASGTKVQIKQLFYNVLPRRKFLKSERAEKAAVKAVISDFALAHPDLRFVLVSDGVEAQSFGRVGSFFARVAELKAAGREPISVDDQVVTPTGMISVEAMLGPPASAVSGSGRMRFIVNGRTVRDRLLIGAVRGGYGTFLKAGKYPIGVLKLEVPVTDIDVNVHPQKTEVRFRDSSQVFLAVSRAIGRALAGLPPVVSNVESMNLPFSSQNFVEPKTDASVSSVRAQFFDSREVPRENALAQADEQTQIETAECQVSEQAHSSRRVEENSLGDMRFVGQVFGCYLILEGNSRLVIVDMHAAHERVVFCKLKQQYADGKVLTQALLIPEVVEPPQGVLESFVEFQDDFRRLGFDCEVFGDRSIVVRSVPALLGGVSAGLILEDLFSLAGVGDWSAKLESMFDMVIARLACHGSVRSGRILEREEVYELLESLEKAESSAFCPHGRPVAREMRLGEFEAMFGRT